MTLAAALDGLSGVPRLLVAVDFDGVLAPIVDDPSTSAPLPAAAEALRTLAALPDTAVAVLSGRRLADLEALTGLVDVARLVGSHGAEFGGGAAPLDADARGRLAWLTTTLERIAAGRPGVYVETKPVSAVLHTRTASRPDAYAAVREAEAVLDGVDGLHVVMGKEVVDVSVVAADKGTALTLVQHATAADGVFFAGDDVTDENAFRVLGPGDVGVKVGPGETVAAYRVPDPPAFALVLADLVRARSGRVR